MDKKASLAGNAAKLTTSKLITMIISMVSAMLLARFRSYDEYGTYSQLMVIIDLSTTIIMMGLPNCLNYFIARTDSIDERSQFVSVYYTVNTILSAVTGGILLVLTPVWVSYFNNPLITTFAYFLAIFPWTKIICSSVENLLIVYEKTTLLMIYRVSNSALLLGIILFVQACNFDFAFYMLLYAIVEIGFTVCVYVFVHKIVGTLKPSFDALVFRSMLVFSIPIGLSSMVGTLNTQLDKIMIGGLLNTEQYAIYAIASKELPLAIVASSITAVLLPHLTKMLKNKETRGAVDLWGVATTLSYRIICFISISLVVFSPEVITFLYSDKYVAGSGVFSVYSLVLLIRCTYWGIILNASGKTKFILYSSIGSLAMNVVLNYVFYHLIGFEGPAVATLIAQIVITILQLIATSRFTKISFATIMPWKRLFAITTYNVVFGIGVYFLKTCIPLELFVGSVMEAVILGSIWMLISFAIQFKRIKNEWIILQNA